VAPPPSPERRDAPDAVAPELQCLREVLAPELLHAAQRRADQLGIGADQVLIRWGMIGEMAYLRQLSAHLGIAEAPLPAAGREATPLHDHQIQFAAAAGLLPLRLNGELLWTVAPRRLAARTICRLTTFYPSTVARLRVASTASLRQFLQRHGATTLAELASYSLHRRFPALSAAPRGGVGRNPATLYRVIGAMLVALAPLLLADVLWSMLSALMFLAFTGVRLAAAVASRPALPPMARCPDDALPTYTVVAALYREAASVAPLLHAIEALDYPREKLDVILVVEPDDTQTLAAIARLGPRPHLQVLVAPAHGPRTKPKALNFALPFVRGAYLGVFDAEDRPDPGQLRAALAAFAQGGPQVACVQASLCIDNLSHSWLSRLFAAEYAGQFDAVLPGMARFRLPLPLGGSSNHFQTAALRAVGAWDPYNVTEDADLGFRLVRFGYRAVTFHSVTFEEAPLKFGAWLRQRSRWMKGWMQTWCVHMRHPVALWREAGWRGAVTLNLVVGGAVVTALLHPLLLASLGYALVRLLGGEPLALAVGPLTLLYAATIMAGYAGSAAVALLGLARRDRLRQGWWLLLMPGYWVCLSIAAWRALGQFIWRPYHWEKTEHGLARRPLRVAAAVVLAVPAQRYRRRSAAAASGLRLISNGATKRPSRSIR
jgi:cellulose synthase/poly-beta-1,6-N-acetylglucosamine synthase-like glycosyltransferase